jgi:ABC-type transport system substrate-binding protein/class 3 adenylate cyclase
VGRAQKRLVAVLLADVAGSTAIAETLGTERSKFLFDELTRLITAEVRRFDGTVAQLMGDGLLAVFGAPSAHDDDAERAVRAALAAQAAVERYAAEVRQAYGVDLRLRAAVEVGSVVVDLDVEDSSERFNALGDPVNVAARLQEQAETGAVVLGPEAARAVTRRFELEPLGESALRGRSATVNAFRVCGSPPERAAAGDPAMVGRDAERAMLGAAMDELADGRGVVVAVTGEAGIGKTRLVRDAVQSAGGRVSVVEGHGASYAAGFPLWPIRDLLRGWLDMPVVAGDAQVRLELKARLAELFGEPGDRYAFLAGVLGLGHEAGASDALSELSHENVRERTVEAVADLLSALAEQRPLLVVLDDLHWADAATLALVEGLLELTDQASVGIAMLYRSERDSAAWGVGERARQRFPHRYREIELRPLAGEASARLADESARGPLPPEVVEIVVERAGGNPFFIQEAVRDLLEREVLARNGGGLMLTVDPAGLAVPVAVTSALQARIDRLPADARQVLAMAAVVGRRFPLELLQRLLDADTVRVGLGELLRAELITEERRRPSPEYRFRHGLVQEVAYGSLLEADRRAAHERVADALQAVAAANGTAPPAPVLARHLAEADLPERAASALIVAGDEARSMWATAEAVARYREARAFLARLGDDRRSRETLFKIALVHHLDFDYPQAERAYDEAFSCGPGMEPAPEPVETLHTVVARPEEIVPGYVNVYEAACLTDLLYSGLLDLDQELNVVPALAENFRVSADGRSYLFQLREGLRWSDGEPLTAHDFTYTWDRMRELEVHTAYQLDDLQSATAHDDHTLEVVVREPRNYFPYVLALAAARPWPRHICQRLGEDWRRGPLVTSGPYRPVSLDDTGLVAEANPMWTGRRGNLARIEVEFHPLKGHLTASLARWRAGELDALVVAARPAQDEQNTVTSEVAGLMTMILRLNARRPALRRPELRRALLAAIDTAELVTHAEGSLRPAQPAGLIPPAMPGHSRRSGVGHDRERALQLLAEAGHPGGDGLPELALAAHGWMLPVAHALVAQLAAVGIHVDVRVMDGAHGIVQRPADADLRLSSWVADYADPDGFFRGILEGEDCFDTDGGETLRMLHAARAVRDHDLRLAAYRDVDRRVVQELAVFAPIGYPRTTLLTRPWVKHAWASPVTPLRLSDVCVEREPSVT